MNGLLTSTVSRTNFTLRFKLAAAVNVRYFMGTEILVFFIPVPFIFWFWNLWQIAIKKTRPKGLMLFGCGFIFMLYMVLPITTKQYFMQGLVYGGVLYLPFYLLLLLVVTGVLAIYHQRQSVNKT
jgi:hypothetical protein